MDLQVRNILIVDDSEEITSELRRCLNNIENNIIVKNSVDDALHFLDILEDEVDLVISEIKMPIKSGFDFFNSVKQDNIFGHIPFFFMSATDDLAVIEKASNLGALDYICKPINISVLMAKINMLFSEPKFNSSIALKPYVETLRSKYKILIVDDNEDMLDVLLMIIEGDFNIETCCCQSGNAAIEELKSYSDYLLIVSDYDMPDGNGEDLFNYIKKENIKMPMILFTARDAKELNWSCEFFTYNRLNKYIQKSVDVFSLTDAIKNILNDKIFTQLNIEQNDSEYIRLRANCLSKFNNVGSDVFIKMLDGSFSKIFDKEENYSLVEIDKYVKQEVELLYVLRADFFQFITKLELEILNCFKLEAPTISSVEDKIIEVNALVQRKLQMVGISPITVAVVDKTIKMTIDILTKKPMILDQLEVFKSSLDYRSEHCLLIAYVACMMAQRLGWSASGTLFKLCLSSFFHDVTLTDVRLMRVRSLEDGEKDGFNRQEIEIIRSHPAASYNLITKFMQLPTDVDKIILQHHEHPLGSGFPRILKASDIHGLAGVFIVAESFVDKLYDDGLNKQSLAQSFIFLEKEYDSGLFKRLGQSLVASFH